MLMPGGLDEMCRLNPYGYCYEAQICDAKAAGRQSDR